MDFERLAHQHKDAVYRQMLRVCGNREDAEDVLIEALLKAHRGLDALRRKEALLPLLQLSALEESGFEAVDRKPSAEELARIGEMKAIFTTALHSLPADYRTVYELRALEQLSGEETAHRLGLSLAATKSRWHRARKLLRERLDAALVPDRGNRNEGIGRTS
jgi:RNA polymerase sigma-70 factor (ECF subfamily)